MAPARIPRHRFAGGRHFPKIGFQAPVDHQLLGELGEHHPTAPPLAGFLHGVGVGDGLAHHGDKGVAFLHGGGNGRRGLLAVPLPGQHQGDHGLGVYGVDRLGHRLCNGQLLPFGDDEHLFPRPHPHTGLYHPFGSFYHQNFIHKSYLHGVPPLSYCAAAPGNRTQAGSVPGSKDGSLVQRELSANAD